MWHSFFTSSAIHVGHFLSHRLHISGLIVPYTGPDMGSGQSRFGNNNNRNPQYPYGGHPYSMPYAGAQPGFAPPYAPYGQPMYPNQGFIPPATHFGQGAYLPPPLLNFLPQDRHFKRSSRGSRSRQRNSDRFVGGFAGAAGMPQAEREYTTFCCCQCRPNCLW